MKTSRLVKIDGQGKPIVVVQKSKQKIIVKSKFF